MYVCRSIEFARGTNSPLDRDPEAEAEDKIEDEKAPAEEEVAQPAEGGFGGGGDWEAAPAGFAGATAAAGWDDAAPNQQWDANTGGAQWGDDTTGAAAAAKDQPSQW